MPLVLSLKEGEDFYVGEEQFVVTEILGEMKFRLKHPVRKTIGRITIETAKSYTVTDKHATKIMNEVFVSAGDQCPTGMIRAAIEAPKKMLILRGTKKRNPPAHILSKAA